MHIAYWAPAWPLEKFHNGIITFVHLIKEALENRGHSVSVFTNKVSAEDLSPGIHRIDSKGWRSVRRAAARRLGLAQDDIFDAAPMADEIMRVHRRHRIDVVEMEESFGWFAQIARRTAIPVVVKLHGPAFLSLIEAELDSASGRERVEREGRALQSALAVASPSLLTMEQTSARYGLNPPLRLHIPNPVTIGRNSPVWSLNSCDGNTILFVGRVDRRKGADIVLHAFSKVLAIRPQTKLIFVGQDYGIVENDGRTLRFAEYCAEHFAPAFREHIEFRGGMGNHEVKELRARCMVTVVASRWENAGYTVLEAMVQGCPIVCSDAGGSPESILHCITGRLAQSENPQAFADQILAMLDDPDAAKLLGERARERANDLHSADRIVTQSLEFYERTISLHGRSLPQYRW